jgi:FlaA1/EpsC-like NDP-sugar epimerase
MSVTFLRKSDTIGTMKNSRWIVTGGTGSFAWHFIAYVLYNLAPAKVTVLSRDEHKQHDMRASFDDDRLQFVIGDVRDREVVRDAVSEHDYVVHAAALKHVQTGQRWPMEVSRTNIDGTRNVVDASNAAGASMVLLSTDKAVNPVNYYGASKMLAEAVTLQGGQRVVRYGNVFGSRGSVLHKFRDAAANGHRFRITDKRMTRFVITFDEAIQMVLFALDGGLPLSLPTGLRAMQIVDLARAFDSDAQFDEIGMFDGEKLHEELAPGVTSDSVRKMGVEEIRSLINETV